MHLKLDGLNSNEFSGGAYMKELISKNWHFPLR